MNQKLPFGPVMIDVAGLTLTDIEKEIINHPNTGAIILFARNFADPEQMTDLITEIRAARNGTILIAVDQEGGRVQRFQNGFTRLPPAACYADFPDDTARLAHSAGWLMAAELLAIGVDFSFAPVLDVDCGISTIIGNRAFAQDEYQAARLASSFRKGMNEAGMAAVGKHFPGHGAIAQDSHLTLPIDERDLNSIRAKDLVPFQRLINEGLEGIMPAHVVYPQIDTQPAGFSAIWIKQILRQELGYEGVVFSDDLSMEGASVAGNFKDRARLALQAGCDMVLVCNNPEAAIQVLESTPIEENAAREKRLSNMIGKPQIKLPQLLKTEKWQTLSKQISCITEKT